MGTKGSKRELTPAQIKSQTELAQLASANDEKVEKLAGMGATLNPLVVMQLKLDCILSYGLSASKQTFVARKYGERLGQLLDEAIASAPTQQARERLHLPA